jgi:hypothetical protein
MTCVSTSAAAAVVALLAAQAAPPAPPAAAPADAEFTKRVNAAVDRADEWLQKRQQPDGGYGVYEFDGGRTYVAGQTALALLARIASGESAFSDSIRRGFEHLKKNPPRLTYETGLTLMVFDARAAPVGERLALTRMTPDELSKYAFPRTLEPGDREYLQPLVDRLSRERFKQGWSYGGNATNAPPTTADLSNTQYAVLGLKAASRMGLTFDRALFSDLLEYLLDVQEPGGKEKEIKFVDLRDGADGKPKRYARRVEARGWAYTWGTRGGDEVVGSRTCIGIGCLLLTLDDLLTKGNGMPLQIARRRRKQVGDAIESGLAWLQQNFAVEHHPPLRPGAVEPGYFYYYLYALERVGALTDRRYVGEHDWYREGAEELLKRQRPDGSWPSGGWDNELVNTCFALLFLRRATLRGSITGG